MYFKNYKYFQKEYKEENAWKDILNNIQHFFK